MDSPAPLARKLKQLGMNAQLMGAGGFVSQTFLTLAQREGEGVVALERAAAGTDAGRQGV